MQRSGPKTRRHYSRVLVGLEPARRRRRVRLEAFAQTWRTDQFAHPNYKGVLQSDGYEAYAAYARAHDQVVWAGCWTHARRGFFEAQSEAPQRIGFILRLIGQL